MKKNLNLWSFIITFICIVLFFVVISSNEVVNSVTNLIGMHPLNLVLIILLVNLVLGVFGFSGLDGWPAKLRSITTIILTLGLSVVILYSILMANSFMFT